MEIDRERLEALREVRRKVAEYVALLESAGLRLTGAPAPARAPRVPEAAIAPSPAAREPAPRPGSPAHPPPGADPVPAAPRPVIPADPGDLFTPPEDDHLPLTLEAVREELGECTRCKLHAGRTHIVFGEGNPQAEILFIGEGPGEEEDRRARPFVGRAGKKLTEIIEKGMKLRREDVYIANIVKCRPPGNREPDREETAACRPFLMKQIRAIRPKVIVALGRPATSLLLGHNVSITRLRGQWQEFQGVPLMPTYHPAFLLRQYTEKNRRDVWNDMRQVLERIGKHR